tara:strand:- start:332 stop:1108 length:777 start_codon:yes stop_codon:yes gene_type:complete
MGLIIKNFSAGYSNKKVIEEISFDLKKNEWIGIIGSNGSGKSTLLKGILKFIPTLSGDVYFEKNSLKNLSRKNLSRLIAYLPQKLNNNLNITVKDLISLGRSPYKKFWDFNFNERDLNIVDDALEIMDLNELQDKFINELSGGQSQRAFLAMIIAQNSKVLLLDEPTTFLDINYQIKLLESLKKLLQIKKISIITVLHDVNLAARFCDRIAILKEGRLVDINTPKKVLNIENFKMGFEINSHIINTPVGLQVIPDGNI